MAAISHLVPDIGTRSTNRALPEHHPTLVESSSMLQVLKLGSDVRGKVGKEPSWLVKFDVIPLCALLGSLVDSAGTSRHWRVGFPLRCACDAQPHIAISTPVHLYVILGPTVLFSITNFLTCLVSVQQGFNVFALVSRFSPSQEGFNLNTLVS